MGISAIDAGSVHRITSGQVIVDLATAVKELVDNALDAHASTLEVRFRNYGLDSVEVIDNGDGVASSDFDGIALKYHTSKLRSFDEVQTVKTLGFRGEAVSSLCALADVSIVTSQSGSLATKLEYDHYGRITSQTNVSGRKGTTVSFANLFGTLPVRRKDIEKNSRREFAKAILWLQSYAVISDSVLFTVTHTTAAGKRSVVLRSMGTNVKSNMVNVFGPGSVDGLEPLDLTLQWAQKSVLTEKLESTVHISGFISQPTFGKGRAASDRQLFYVNNRPCGLPTIQKAINEVYKQFNYIQFPTLVCNVKIDPQNVDINVAPDKRTVLIFQESALIECLKEKLVEFYDSSSQAQLRRVHVQQEVRPAKLAQSRLSALSRLRADATEGDEEEEQPEVNGEINNDDAESSVSESPDDSESEDEENEEEEQMVEDDRSVQDLAIPEIKAEGANEEENVEGAEAEEKDVEADVEQEAGGDSSVSNVPEGVETHSRRQRGLVQTLTTRVEREPVDLPPGVELVEVISVERELESEQGPESDEEVVPVSKKRALGQLDSSSSKKGGESLASLETDISTDFSSTDNAEIPPQIRDLQEPRKMAKTFHTLNTHVVNPLRGEEILKGWDQIHRIAGEIEQARQANGSRHMGVSTVDITDSTEALDRLNLTVNKKDFAEMVVIGQFNLGFILVSKKNSDGSSDLFIIDQHASDEKANFERLQAETSMQHQPLVMGRKLELTVIEEINAINNLHVLEKNGFVVKVDEEAPPGSQCTLTALPYSKTTVFDETDLAELLYLIGESGGSPHVRCSKVRAMFAMRACRSSIMIGQSLGITTMERVVRRLAELDKPWSCPHGRPTLRHMTSIDRWTGFTEDLD